ncbi:MAG: hypothetical protein U0703_19820 [Anaerolineae bacterium]
MRKLILLIGILVLAFPVYAQDATPEATAMEPWTCPDGFQGQTLNVFNWTTYIADALTIPDFEAAYGVSIVYGTYNNKEALLTSAQQQLATTSSCKPTAWSPP